jgi:hypothetical protein
MAGQIGIQLDGDDAGGPFEKLGGERPTAGADLNHGAWGAPLLRLRTRRPSDALQYGALGQEMLAEFLARHAGVCPVRPASCD